MIKRFTQPYQQMLIGIDNRGLQFLNHIVSPSLFFCRYFCEKTLRITIDEKNYNWERYECSYLVFYNPQKKLLIDKELKRKCCLESKNIASHSRYLLTVIRILNYTNFYYNLSFVEFTMTATNLFLQQIVMGSNFSLT